MGLERRAFWAEVSSGGCSAGLFPDVVAPDDAAASVVGGGDADLRGIARTKEEGERQTGAERRRRSELTGKRSGEQPDPTGLKEITKTWREEEHELDWKHAKGRDGETEREGKPFVFHGLIYELIWAEPQLLDWVHALTGMVKKMGPICTSSSSNE